MTDREFYKALGGRLKTQIKLVGLTLENVGGIIGVSYQQAAKYLSGENRIPLDKLLMLTDVLGIDAAEILQISSNKMKDGAPDMDKTSAYINGYVEERLLAESEERAKELEKMLRKERDRNLELKKTVNRLTERLTIRRKMNKLERQNADS